MDVAADRGVSEYVLAHGGVLWVRSNRQRCCGGPMTTLRATTAEPRDDERYETVPSALPFTVRFLAAAGRPAHLSLALRGVARRHPVAFWDGCTFRL